MRGADTFTESLFSMRRLDDFVPDSHPLRAVRKMVNLALKRTEPLLSGMYAANIKGGRPSIAPEKLLRAMLLQIFYSIRSERMLMEQTQSRLLFRRFIGLSMDDSHKRGHPAATAGDLPADSPHHGRACLARLAGTSRVARPSGYVQPEQWPAIRFAVHGA